jgi:septum formation protein
MLILASQSKIRRILLSQAGVLFETKTTPLDEVNAHIKYGHLAPKILASALALAKSQAASALYPNATVIAVDQILELENEVIHKPATIEEAHGHLQRLRGHTHHLHTAFSITQNTTLLSQHTDTATLTMRQFSDAFLQNYLEICTEDTLKCVGCYQYELTGSQLMSHVQGDYFSILGLPLLPLLAALRQLGHVLS